MRDALARRRPSREPALSETERRERERKQTKKKKKFTLSSLLILLQSAPASTNPKQTRITMARFISTSNLVALLSARRGFSSAAAAMGRSAAAEESVMMMMMKGDKEGGANAGTVWTSSWVPDPVTGYYRPANRVGEIDPAELRQIVLSRKSSS